MGGLPCHSGAGGGLTRLVACRPCHHCPRRGACLLCRLPTLPLACFPAPYPPARARRALFPGGEGGDQGYFMQGAPPLASPALNRLRHLQTFSNMNPAEGLPGWSPADLAAAVPSGGLNPSGTCSPCPGGRGPSQTPPSLATDSSISPGPPSPWLPAQPMERRFFRFCAEPQAPMRRAPAWQVL